MAPGDKQPVLVTLPATTATTNSEAVSVRDGDAAQKLSKAAELFQIAERAKIEMARAQVVNFAEIFAVKLREKLARTSSPLPSASSLPVNAEQAAALAATYLAGQFTPFKRLALRVMAALIAWGAGRAAWGQALQTRQRWRATNLAQAFLLGPASSEEDKLLQTDRALRHIAEEVTKRHFAQIIPLTKPSQAVLASAMATRIVRHLKRHAHGLERESRKPIEADLQHGYVAVMQLYHRVFSPPDRSPAAPCIPLVDRCMRALTAETSEPLDDTLVEFEPFFASADGKFASQPWTVGGILNRPGLRVDGQNLYIRACLFVLVAGGA